MTTSIITSKGQTTIPKEIREHLHLKPHDRLLYIQDKDKIIIQPLSGTILDLKGAFPVKGELDFKGLREKMIKHAAVKTLAKQ